MSKPQPADGSAELQTSAIHAEAILKGEFRRIPLAELHESSWNPRKYFPEAAQAKLAESIRREGFWDWAALMVRPRAKGGYEIGAGHRRARAAKAAGLTEVPCFVRNLSDPEFLVVVTFDNSNREDVHELDEAAGFRFYMDRTGATVPQIAARIGQSEGYVYQRLKYADLIPAAVKAFWDEKITAGQAILLARLQPPIQTELLKYVIERAKYHAVSVRDLMEKIEREVHRDVRKACFDSSDAKLLPGVPSCRDCLKRAGNSPELFADIKSPQTCTDPACYVRKERAFIQLEIERRNTDPDPEKPPLARVSTAYQYQGKPPAGVLARADYQLIEGKKDSCAHARDAIVAHGEEKFGRMVRICAEKTCKKHHAVSSSYRRDPREIARERLRKEEARRNEVVAFRVRKAIAAKCAPPWRRRELLLIAYSIVHRMWHDLQVKVCSSWGLTPIEIKSPYKHKDYAGTIMNHLQGLGGGPGGLAEALIELALWGPETQRRAAAAKEYRVDVRSIEKAVAAEMRKPPAKKKKTSSHAVA